MERKESDYLNSGNLQLRKWQTNRNHRIFTVRCIKVRTTQVGCRIRISLEISKCYKIIQKVKDNYCMNGLET